MTRWKNSPKTARLSESRTFTRHTYIDGDSVKECLIGGKPIDDNRKYVVATIDFLYQGGDNLYPLKYSNWMVETHKKLMDIFIEYIQNLTAQGKKIEKSKDNRLVVENKKK